MSHAIKKAKSLLSSRETFKRTKSRIIPKETVNRAKSFLARKETTEPTKPIIVQKKSVEKPYESKLMICVEILCTLVSNGPMKLTLLSDKFEIGQSRLEPHLRLLWDRGLVEEEKFGENGKHYVISNRGRRLLKIIGPLLKEAHKIHMNDFEAITTALSGAGYS